MTPKQNPGNPREYCGFILINKPRGITSFKVLSPLKRYFPKHRIGHAGTLDQDARGLIIAGVGKATRLLRFVESFSKTYHFKLSFGFETDTGDACGTPLGEPLELRVQVAEIEKVLGQFTGEIAQTPPIYSALKIQGRRASDRARDGEQVTMHTRKIQIYSLTIDSDQPQAHENIFAMVCTCSKGTYIRSLGRDIARSLNHRAHVFDINRVATGSLKIEDSVSPNSDINYQEHLLSPQKIFTDYNIYHVSDDVLKRLRQGLMQAVHRHGLQLNSGVGVPFFIADNLGGVALVAEANQDGDIIPKIQLNSVA
jgi:tRNA pseudouridine55 synthase